LAFRQVALERLKVFVPEGAFDWILHYLKQYKIDLKITPERKSKLGDYTFDLQTQRHKISINGNLNQYEFFFTFVHELAHLLTYVQYQHRVDAHGREWKSCFEQLLRTCIHLFPEPLQAAIHKHLSSTKSSQCFDTNLYLALRSYDQQQRLYVKDVSISGCFMIKNGDIFRVLSKRRTRYVCENIRTKQQFLFPQLYEITQIINDSESSI